jgi:hypothetical protein
MAVRADDIAFGDLCKKDRAILERTSRDEERLLSGHAVIEVHLARIKGSPTVRARLVGILPKERAGRNLTSANTIDLGFAVSRVVRLVERPLISLGHAVF